MPPAWQQVRISPYPNGHIQAVGTDDAGRRQYLYHDVWREQRDREKHEHVLTVARRLPTARTVAAEQLSAKGCPRERVLAAAFRLLDLGLFRIGGEQYVEDNGSFGLATLRREHVRISGGAVAFDYPAKGGQERQQEIVDDDVSAVLRGLLHRRHESAELLAYQRGRRWCDVRSEVSHYLGNTPTVAKKSYVDPRIVDLYHDGTTVRAALECAGRDGDRGTPLLHGDVERAVLRMLAGA